MVTEDPQILGATVQNVDAKETWYPDLCNLGVLFSNCTKYFEAPHSKFVPHTSYPG
jgi:hypothetical protein